MIQSLIDLTISRRLYDAGINEESRYEWVSDSETGEWQIRATDFYDLYDGPSYCAGRLSYYAYSEDELMEMLPPSICPVLKNTDRVWTLENDYFQTKIQAESRQNLLAEFLLFFKKQGL